MGLTGYWGMSEQPCIHSAYSRSRRSERGLRSHTAWHSSSEGVLPVSTITCRMVRPACSEASNAACAEALICSEVGARCGALELGHSQIELATTAAHTRPTVANFPLIVMGGEGNSRAQLGRWPLWGRFDEDLGKRPGLLLAPIGPAFNGVGSLSKRHARCRARPLVECAVRADRSRAPPATPDSPSPAEPGWLLGGPSPGAAKGRRGKG